VALPAQVWSLPTYRFAYTLTGHQNWVRACQFSPDGRLAVSGGDDKTVKVGPGPGDGQGWELDRDGVGAVDVAVGAGKPLL
jgi:WD40 repeat protein